MQKYLNYENHSAFSDTLGERVSFVGPTQPIKLDSPHMLRGPEVEFPQINYRDIPGSEVWAYDENFNKISTHSSANNAAQSFYISKHSALFNMNRRFAACIVGGVLMKVLFAWNPDTPIGTLSTAVIVIDTYTNTSYKYESLKQVCKALLYGGKTTALKNTYLNFPVLFGDRYSIVTSDEYLLNTPPVVGPMPLLDEKLKRRGGKPAKEIVLFDTFANTATVFPTKSAVLQHFQMNVKGTSTLSRYIDNDKLFKSQYKLYSRDNYQGDITI